MFHKTNLGRFGNSLPCDRAGFVPEAGDRFDAFGFGGDLEWQRELAMEAGMCLGVAAYNDMMGWGGDDEDG